MDWSNDNVILFIELLQEEPCIWNPKSRDHKSKNLINDAWARIKNKFSMPCSVEELRKKRNILLTQYRECLKKIKDSTKTVSGDEIYKPTWFAFDAMHNYMGAVYDYRPASYTEEQTTPHCDRIKIRESDIESGSDSPLSDTTRACHKRKNTSKDPLDVKKQADETVSLVRERSVQRGADENDLFGQILAQKLKKMNDEDRLMLTHEIQNLVFKYEMKAMSRLNDQSAPSLTCTHVWRRL